ncbi:MAG: hypothetical protein NCW75_05620 [Phycisphaera sp.]|nr:MAG: hypothetical protein NCW75_05620 [Phycisphaera sp.]
MEIKRVVAVSFLIAIGLAGACAPSTSQIATLDKEQLWKAAPKIYAPGPFSVNTKGIQAARERAIELYEWDDQVDAQVRKGAFGTGSPAAAVYYSRGPPTDTRESSSSFGSRYTWQYGTPSLYISDVLYVYFDEDWIVTSWHRYKDK